MRFPIQVSVEARSQELIDIMVKALRKFITQESLWINGRRHDVFWNDQPVELLPQSGIDYIPKVQYTFGVEATENINDRESVPATTTIVVTPNIN